MLQVASPTSPLKTSWPDRSGIPKASMLKDAYPLFVCGGRMRQVVDKALAAMTEERIAVPPDLEERVRAYLKANPSESWNDAVEVVAKEDGEND